MSFVCPSRGWASCAWTTTTSNNSICKVHPLVAYEIMQHDDVAFFNNAANCLSLCVYYEHLSCTKSPLFTVQEAIRVGGSSRTCVFPTISTGTPQPLSWLLGVVDSNHISHSHCSSSPCTIEPEDFTPTASPFATTDSKPRTGVCTSTWISSTGEPSSPMV